MKYFKRPFILAPILLSSCLTDDYESEDFKGFTIAELHGEWKVVQRSYYDESLKEHIILPLDACDINEKIVFDVHGDGYHYLSHNTEEPCTYDEIGIKLTEKTSYTKLVTVKTPYDISYVSIQMQAPKEFGFVLNTRYYLGNDTTMISDYVQKVE